MTLPAQNFEKKQFFFSILNRSPGSLGPFWGPWGGKNRIFIKKFKIFGLFFSILDRSPGSLGPFWGPWGGPGAQKKAQKIPKISKKIPKNSLKNYSKSRKSKNSRKNLCFCTIVHLTARIDAILKKIILIFKAASVRTHFRGGLWAQMPILWKMV